MDHGWFEYSPIVERPRLQWPNEAQLAVWVAPNIEHFHFLAPRRDGAPPDMRSYIAHDYSLRVAVWRLMKLFDKLQIPATIALNAEVCDYEPQVIRAGQDRGWEWMGHNLTNSTRLNGIGEDEERYLISATLQKIEAATGRRPRGWLGPGLDETERTPELLCEAGVDYIADWSNDDQPYPMHTKHGRIFAIPYTLELNDINFGLAPAQPFDEFGRRIKDAFDVLYAEGAESARVMCIALHPYISAAAHRIKYLEDALSYIKRHHRVWWTTGSQIIDAYRAQLDG